MNREELKKLPKVELHCHMDGSLTLDFISQTLGRKVDLAEIQAPDDCSSLAEYLERFDLPIASLHDVASFKEGARTFLVSLKEENVVYVEVRFAPLHHANENLCTKDIVEAVIAGLEEGKKETGIEYGVILCAMRHHDQKDSLQMFKDALPYLHHGVVAADLAGGEVPAPMINYMDLFEEVQKLGYPLTLHAGECGYAPNVQHSVEVGARRIGHGIAITGNEKIKKICKDKGAVLEMCPISNIQTKAIDDPAKYPLREFLDEGLLVTINTDNRMVSGTSLTREYEWIQANCGVTDEELLQLIRNAMEYSFASPEVKAKILEMLR